MRFVESELRLGQTREAIKYSKDAGGETVQCLELSLTQRISKGKYKDTTKCF